MNIFALILVFLGLMAGLRAEEHHYNPTKYWREFTSTVSPALRIRPGDIVHTKCVDSNGADETGNRVTLPYNPLTGPFYVEGAEPGDHLVVILEKVRLNRNSGIGSSAISHAAVTSSYLLNWGGHSRAVRWKFDFESMTATPQVTGELNNLRVPLRPFLGAVGVSPPEQKAEYSPLSARMASAASSITADNHGGNVDYNRLVEGTKLFFPVYVPGAYLFLGDGHAAQGDGEISGGAIETSMEVRFRVQLEKDKSIPAMRAESEQEYMALGTGRPLEEAFRSATENMIEWLVTSFPLTNEDAHVILGTSGEYDIAVVAIPRYTVVCKVRKSTLSGLFDLPER